MLAIEHAYNTIQTKLSPVRLVRPRTLGFHSSNRGSNPLRDAILILHLFLWLSENMESIRLHFAKEGWLL